MQNISFRPLEHADLDIRVKWLNNSKVNHFLGPEYRKGGITIEQQEKWFDKLRQDDSRRMFTIFIDQMAVGTVGLTEISPSDRNAGLFIMIGEESCWSKGIARQAIKFITDYGFKEFDLHKIWLYVYSPNERAINLYKASGFREEARLKDMAIIDGVFCDEVVMSIFN